MKPQIDRFSRLFFVILLLLLTRTAVWAQVDIDIDLDGPEWYERPLVWVGAAAFLLVLAFIVRSRR